ncbi:ERF family protein [Pseudanabaena phage Pan3]|nr:ERF family protein [Pseudanabaena phage Pan3]
MSEVYSAISAVQGELAKVGIAKGRRNQQQGYNFRGIDEVYAALSPLLSKHGLCVIPRCLTREMVEGRTAKGSPLFNVTVYAEFDFVSAKDGSKHTAATFGEAMDTADKATNKAMSAAYKYAAFMTFAIPTEGDNDADAHTHDVAPSRTGEGHSQQGAVSPPPTHTGEPDGKAKRGLDGPYTSKAKLFAAFTALQNEVVRCGDDETLTCLLATEENKALIAQCERDAPHYLHGGDPAPEDFEPLFARIQRMRDVFQLENA